MSFELILFAHVYSMHRAEFYYMCLCDAVFIEFGLLQTTKFNDTSCKLLGLFVTQFIVRSLSVFQTSEYIC
jgi:hypothetical protein